MKSQGDTEAGAGYMQTHYLFAPAGVQCIEEQVGLLGRYAPQLGSWLQSQASPDCVCAVEQ